MHQNIFLVLDFRCGLVSLLLLFCRSNISSFFSWNCYCSGDGYVVLCVSLILISYVDVVFY